MRSHYFIFNLLLTLSFLFESAYLKLGKSKEEKPTKEFDEPQEKQEENIAFSEDTLNEAEKEYLFFLDKNSNDSATIVANYVNPYFKHFGLNDLNLSEGNRIVHKLNTKPKVLVNNKKDNSDRNKNKNPKEAAASKGVIKAKRVKTFLNLDE